MNWTEHLSRWEIVWAVVVGVLASARLTRLVVFDNYPPIAWLRSKWDTWTGGNDWNFLVHCGYCAAPWITLVVGGVGVLTHLPLWWWLFCGWLAASYVAAITVAFDGDEGD